VRLSVDSLKRRSCTFDGHGNLPRKFIEAGMGPAVKLLLNAISWQT
jgi:hypothetical protein